LTRSHGILSLFLDQPDGPFLDLRREPAFSSHHRILSNNSVTDKPGAIQKVDNSKMPIGLLTWEDAMGILNEVFASERSM